VHSGPNNPDIILFVNTTEHNGPGANDMSVPRRGGARVDAVLR
jgi:hypothetical protein